MRKKGRALELIDSIEGAKRNIAKCVENDDIKESKRFFQILQNAVLELRELVISENETF